MNEYDKDDLGVVTGHLWRLQYELDKLENKLSRTVLSLEKSLQEEGEEKVPDLIDETDYEIISKTSTSELEEKLHQRKFAGVTKDTDDYCRMVNTVNAEDVNIPEDKISVNFGSMNYTWKTCDYWSLPSWLQTNCFIFKGYRPPLPSFQVCFLSIFRIHTETINIWSHLLGCLLFIALFLHAILSSLPLEDKLVISPFFIGAILCLGFSTTFHTVHCHSEPILSFSSCLDYCGIIILIIGSFIPWLYYTFFCDHILKILYIAGVLTLGTCATIVSLSPTFNEPMYRPLRATVFVIFGLFGVIPGLHFLVTEGWDALFKLVPPLILTAVLYILGAIIYAWRVPERIFPGKFDILFQSHQWFHVLVLLATVIDYIGIVRIASFIQFGRNNPDFCQNKQFYFQKLQAYF